MSNYYKSDCCGEPLTPLFLENGGTCADCPKCKRACVAVAVIDKPGGVPEESISPEHSVGACGHTSNGEFTVTDDIKTRCVLCGQYYKV